MEKIFLPAKTSLSITVIIGLFFIVLGYLNSKKMMMDFIAAAVKKHYIDLVNIIRNKNGN